MVLREFGVNFSVDSAVVAWQLSIMETLPRPLPASQEMEAACRRRDTSYDGVFFLAVRTTGIFCRPSCAARKPLPRNVEYFATVREALFAGYRPCRRCCPLEPSGAAPGWVKELLFRVESSPTARIRDGELRAMGIEPARARRYFTEHYGMTFHAFARGHRIGSALESIRRGADLDDVALGHGYESHSGFREAFSRALGDAPGRSRNTEHLALAWLESPLGPLIAGATDGGVCLLEFTDRRMLEAQLDTVRRRFRMPALPGSNASLVQLRDELAEYFAGTRRSFDVPLLYPGSDFQVRVWNALRDIPYGETRSYEGLAHIVGAPDACRAVGHANGLNRIAIVIPCHRVVNKNGKLGGYGGGLWRKQRLLELERAPVAHVGSEAFDLFAATAPPSELPYITSRTPSSSSTCSTDCSASSPPSAR